MSKFNYHHNDDDQLVAIESVGILRVDVLASPSCHIANVHAHNVLPWWSHVTGVSGAVSTNAELKEGTSALERENFAYLFAGTKFSEISDLPDSNICTREY